MIENYLMAITLVVSVVVFLMTAGPGSVVPFFPQRMFLFCLTASLMAASLFHFIRLFDQSDEWARWYSQWINAIARTGMAVTGCIILAGWNVRCQEKRKQRAG